RESKQQEIEQARQEIRSSTARVDELEVELKATFESRQEINARQSKLHEVQSEILEKVSAKEKQLKEARTGKDSLNAEMHKIDIRLNTLESEARSIVEKISEEYETDIRTVETTNPDPNRPEEESRIHLQELKEQLKKFGAVNLLALEEYKTASEREVFLKEQLEDLRTAKNDLQSTITRINQTARQLFLETFNQVKVNFQNLFVELFAGGEADINLIDPSDPLESDIEIIARPRGKKILSITMMSGGERALTAISLLFSLYLVKPSPFCILDEIDAPLDDANCHRFLRIIRKFSEQTQFIIITHNKISMEAAQNLYGVTMEQFGISKLVAVKFTDNGPDDEDEEVILDTEAGSEEEDTAPEEVVASELRAEEGESGNGNGNGNGNGDSGDSTDHSVFKEPLDTEAPESSDPMVQLDDLPARVVERFNVPVIDKPEDDSGDND
ncbi:MAG TPA: AAA family ATPase, partial [candidate division Zixibacteria bacterium]|nr:AAA family ATPase [candidate division Zixibacteria bacterium]